MDTHNGCLDRADVGSPNQRNDFSFLKLIDGEDRNYTAVEQLGWAHSLGRATHFHNLKDLVMKITGSMIALAVACSALPAQAQVMDGKKMMMAPTMEQCQGGYKKSYMQSMKWSKSKFKKSCNRMMMKNNSMMKEKMMKHKMMKEKMMKDKM